MNQHPMIVLGAIMVIAGGGVFAVRAISSSGDSATGDRATESAAPASSDASGSSTETPSAGPAEASHRDVKATGSDVEPGRGNDGKTETRVEQNVERTSDYVEDTAGDLIVDYWRPGGVNDPEREQQIRNWMERAEIDSSITFFVRTEVHAAARERLVEELVLRRHEDGSVHSDR